MKGAATEETHQVTAEEQNQMVMAKTFDVDLIKVRVMVGEYKKMELAPGDDEQYAVCRTALTSCIRVRTGIDKRRLELNANAQDEIKARNISAKQLSEIVAPAESHLSGLIATEGARLIKIKEAEAEALKKLIDERQMALSALNCPTAYQVVAAMDEFDYDNALFAAQEDFDEAERDREEKEEERKAEAKRLADQKIEQDAEALRIKTGQGRVEIIIGFNRALSLSDAMGMSDGEFDAIKYKAKTDYEAEEKRKADAAEKQKAAQDKLDTDRKEIEEEKQRLMDAEAARQATERARVKAEQDAKDKAVERSFNIPHVSVGGNHEATECDLKAKEREEMKPDREKLAVFFANVQIVVTDVQCAPLSTTAGARELSRSFDEIRATIEECKERAEEL